MPSTHPSFGYREAGLADGEPLVPRHACLVDAAERRVGIFIPDDVLALLESAASVEGGVLERTRGGPVA